VDGSAACGPWALHVLRSAIISFLASSLNGHRRGVQSASRRWLQRRRTGSALAIGQKKARPALAGRAFI